MKTNQQHTPGEWRISKHATPAHSPQFGIYAGDSGRDLATVKGENAEADATLIAAAPELLAALKLRQHFHSHPFCTQSLDLFRAHGYTGTDKSTEMQRWLGDIEDAAIARAESRQ